MPALAGFFPLSPAPFPVFARVRPAGLFPGGALLPLELVGGLEDDVEVVLCVAAPLPPAPAATCGLSRSPAATCGPTDTSGIARGCRILPLQGHLVPNRWVVVGRQLSEPSC